MAIVLMMESESTSETPVNFCQTSRRHNPGDNHLHTRRRKNLKSYYVITGTILFPALKYSTFIHVGDRLWFGRGC
jgi:hypothetical protein